MRVRMTTCAATPEAVFDAGQVYDLPEDTASDWIARGMAEAVEETPTPKQDKGASPRRK